MSLHAADKKCIWDDHLSRLSQQSLRTSARIGSLVQAHPCHTDYLVLRLCGESRVRLSPQMHSLSAARKLILEGNSTLQDAELLWGGL